MQTQVFPTPLEGGKHGVTQTTLLMKQQISAKVYKLIYGLLKVPRYAEFTSATFSNNNQRPRPVSGMRKSRPLLLLLR